MGAAEDWLRGEIDKQKTAETSSAAAEPQTTLPSANEYIKQVVKEQQPMTTGDYIGDVAKSAGSGVLAGAGDLANMAQYVTTPWGLHDASSWLAEKGAQGVDWAAGTDYAKNMKPTYWSPDLRKKLSELTGGADEYKSRSTVGRYARTVGEFLPAAAIPIGGGAGLVARLGMGAVLPGLASEAAGQLAENYAPEYEPYARMAGAIVSPLAGERLLRGGIKMAAPASTTEAVRLAKADTLKKFKIPVLSSQLRDDERLLSKELSTSQGQRIVAVQPKLYTEEMMKTIGSNERLATPGNVEKAKDAIVQTLDDVADSVVAPAHVDDIHKMHDALSTYRGHTGNVRSKPYTENIGQRLLQSERTGVPIDGGTLKAWRRELGRVANETKDTDIARLYNDSIDIIDDMVSRELQRTNRPKDWARLQTARGQYRNYLVLRKAAIQSEKAGMDGVLDHKNVFDHLVAQDPDGLTTRGTIGELTSAVSSIFKSPTKESLRPGFFGKAKDVAERAFYGGGAGYWLGQTLGSYGPLLAGAGTVAAPLVGHLASGAKEALMATKLGQRYRKANSDSIRKILEQDFHPWRNAVKAGAYQDYRNAHPEGEGLVLDVEKALGNEPYVPEEARGGRVGAYRAGGRVTSHEAAADQLVAAAERAKNKWSKSTKTLLQTPDTMVAKALEIANRSI